MGERFDKGDDRIDEDAEVGAGTMLFDGVGGLGITTIEMGKGGGGEVSASGETEDADSLRIDVPFCGVGPGGTQGALSVV